MVALFCGALFPLSLAPFDLWIVGIASLVGLVYAIDVREKRWVLIRYYLFSLGMYGVGASWIFVSINTYGGASYLLSAVLVSLFVVSYSLTSLVAGGVQVLVGRRYLIAVFPAIWVVLEWFRSWFLTGFPWLFAGYGHLDTPLAGYAPVLGVFGLTLVTALSATLAYAVLRRWWPGIGLLALTWVGGLALSQVSWVSDSGATIEVSAVQGNIDQHSKWRPSMVMPILNTYRALTEKEWGRDLVVWPETAITQFRDGAGNVLGSLDQRGRAEGTALVLGIPDRDSSGQFLNSSLAIGNGSGVYHKRRLVPFGEYVPLEDILRGLITFFDLPMSHNRAGQWHQEPLLAGGHALSLSICYEVVYPELVRTTVEEPDLYVTISNDTWFGRSIGPKQHLQMARMRAVENGRWMVRATNNGVTALIDESGAVKGSLALYRADVLRGTARVMRGETPYHRLGHWPVLFVCIVSLLVFGLLPHVQKFVVNRHRRGF